MGGHTRKQVKTCHPEDSFLGAVFSSLLLYILDNFPPKSPLNVNSCATLPHPTGGGETASHTDCPRDQAG